MLPDKLTETSVNVMDRAREEALRMDAIAIDVEHVLLGLLGVSGGIAYFVLTKNKLYWKAIHEHLWNQARDRRDVQSDNTWPSEKVQDLTSRALDISKECNAGLIHTEHLLLALIETKSWRTRDVFDSFAVDLEKLRKDILEVTSKAGSGAGKNPADRVYAKTEPIGVVDFASEEARRLGHNFVGTEQLFLGILKQSETAACILKSFGVTYKQATIEVEKIIGRGSGFVAVETPFTPRAKRVLESSWDEARQLGHNFICTEHLLLGLIRENEGVAGRVLELLKVDTNKLRKAIIDSFSEDDDEGHSSAVPSTGRS